MSRERPSIHGAIVGEALTEIAASVTGDLPKDCCATCAFRPEAMTNRMASAVLDAFKCAVGAGSMFACHHGLVDGHATRVCAGWVASQLADYETVRAIGERMRQRLNALTSDDPDPIRQAFDAWIAEVDPGDSLNDYQRGRLYLRHVAEGRLIPGSTS